MHLVFPCQRKASGLGMNEDGVAAMAAQCIGFGRFNLRPAAADNPPGLRPTPADFRLKYYLIFGLM